MIKRLILIVSILFTVITNAQEGTSSPYSFYGIGLTTFKGTVENRSMGGLSVYSDSIHINLQNPATYGKLALTTYTVGGSHSQVNVKTDSEDGNSSVTTLDYLAIGVPAGKFGFGFGLIPYSSVGYNLASVNEEEGTGGRFSGTGGLNKVYVSAGYEVTKNFSLGAGVDYNFGTIENKNIFLRQEIEYGSREVNRSNLSGVNFNFGLNYNAMLSEKLEVMASAVYAPQRNLSSENRRELATIAYVSGQEFEVESRDLPIEDTEMTLPAQYTLGTGIGQPRKWFLGVEYTNTGASDFNNRSFSQDRASFTEAAKYKVGGFYIPNYSPVASYFNRIVYRAGFRMEQTGLELDGKAIDEFGISFGIGLPAGRTFSNANLGFEYGQRGTTNAGLIQEDFFNLSISLSLNDRWFMKRKFD